MKKSMLCAMIALGLAAWSAPAPAVTCANGVYRAGCAGPNGAAVVKKPPAATVPAVRTYHPAAPAVNCANGVYRAGCVGPNGGAVIRK